MTPEQLATLVNIGSAGAVIAVVMIFLKFIEKRDADWRSFFSTIRAADNAVSADLVKAIKELTGEIENLKSRLNSHEAVEMELLRDMVDKLNKPERRHV